MKRRPIIKLIRMSLRYGVDDPIKLIRIVETNGIPAAFYMQVYKELGRYIE